MAFALFKGIFGGNDIYGEKPNIPAAPTTAGILKDITQANTAVAPEAARLAAMTNKYNQENILANLRGVLGPEAADLIPKEIGKKLYDEIRGNLPASVIANTRNLAAAQGLGSGTGVESGFFKSNLTGDFLRNSYEISNKALNSFQQWLETSSRLLAPTFDVANLYANPAMGMNVANAAYQRDYLAELTRAAPDPTKRGQFDTEMGILGMALSAYSGGPGYTNTYRPPYAAGPGQSGYTTPLDRYSSGGGGGGGFNFFGLGGGGNAPSAQQTAFGNNVGEGWDY